MFKRVIVENWAHFVPIISFVIFAVVFAATTIRALRVSKAEREHLASLPLDEKPESQNLKSR